MISKMFEIFLLSLVIISTITCSGQAKCSCTYNFLGDPAIDINNENYDEFAQPNEDEGSIASSSQVQEDRAILLLDMQDKSKISILLRNNRGDLEGQGNWTRQNDTEKFQAKGSLNGNRLVLDLELQNGESYQFDLAKEGDTVLGDFRLITASTKKILGIAEGKWDT